MRNVFVEGLGGILAGGPWRIDVDGLERLTLSSHANDHARIAAHTALLPAFRQLADTGLCPAPVFFSDRPRAIDAGWRPAPDSQEFETQGFETQSDILQSVLRPSPSDATPLPRLSILDPDVQQSLDRERGVLRIRFPERYRQVATTTTVKLPALATSEGPAPLDGARHAQDALLDLLDRFCVDTSGDGDSLWSLRPPEVSVDRADRKIRFGELPVATLTHDAWSVDADAMSHAREVLEKGLVRRERPVHEWAGPRVPLARRKSPSGPERLRLIVQVEDDQIINDGAVSRQLAHPGETVWIQADAKGRKRILAGKSLLAGVRADARIKVEVHGHGGRAGLTDERTLGGRSAAEVGELLEETMRYCKLRHCIDTVDLTSCALATPVFPRQFAEEVLRSGHDLDVFHSASTITAYADSLTFTLEPDSLEKFVGRRTLFTESSAGDIRAPGKTWIFSLNRETGQVLRRDKHPGLKGALALARDRGADPLPPRGTMGAIGAVEPVGPLEQTSTVPWSGASPWSGLGLLPR